ncbi:MAG TPA: hypothetical protein VNA25_09200, partial [Phycisphaerae bacterium]|nr:hypothetical protein [Phycisphaerae bacterium]
HPREKAKGILHFIALDFAPMHAIARNYARKACGGSPVWRLYSPDGSIYSPWVSRLPGAPAGGQTGRAGRSTSEPFDGPQLAKVTLLWLAFPLTLAVQPRPEVMAKWARETTWRTADLTRLGQASGRASVGIGGPPVA